MTVWNDSTVREIERASIRAFLESCSDELGGRTLDFGCGLQPYRDVVESAGGEYVPYDRAAFPANVSGEDIGDKPTGRFDAIITTQTLQYVPVYAPPDETWSGEHPAVPLLDMLGWLANLLGSNRARSVDPHGGVLVLTYPTTWAIVEVADLYRFTPAGMNQILSLAGFSVERHDERAAIDLDGFRLPLGYGVLARV